MKIKNFLIIFALFMVLLCGVSAISAATDNAVDNLTTGMDDSISVSNDEKAVGVDDSALNAQENDVNNNGVSGVKNSGIDLQNLTDSANDELDEGYVIYVGQNSEDGNGSYENPFKNFRLACDNVTGQEKVTLKIFAGEYDLGGMYYFNTNDLNIMGIEGEVIIKAKFTPKNIDEVYEACDSQQPMGECFGLTSYTGKFSMRNIIFDSSSRTYAGYYDDHTDGPFGTYYFFEPFHLHNRFFQQSNIVNWDVDISGIFKNCSFITYNNIINRGFEFNCTFINCKFVQPTNQLFRASLVNNTIHIFNYCMFNYESNRLASYYYWPFELRMDNCWFGQNTLPSYISNFASYTYNVTGLDSNWDSTANPLKKVSNYTVPISRYAVFNVSQNYLGNNKYEIMGKLTWNGTDSQEGMENFQPMVVKLSSETGILNDTKPILTNGNFKVTYTSSNDNNKINYILDNVDEDLMFTRVNINATPVNIYYGDDQNITVNLSQAINNNVTIVVSNATYNKTYIVKVNGTDSFIYTIPDRLKAGSYDINITLSEGIFFGFNSTTLTVSKYKYGVDEEYVFTAPMPADVKVGENATITITLPKDVNGTVTVKFGNDTQSMDANQTLTVNYTTSKAGDVPVDITYSGNDKYEEHTLSDTLTVGKADSSIEINDAIFTYSETIAIPFNITNANGVTVSVLNKDDDEIATASSTSGIITLDTLPAGEYTLEVTTVVDAANYEWVTETCNLTINKANSTLEISDKEFAYATEAIINVITANSTGNLIATLTDENNNEIPVTDVSGDNITLPLLDVGKYTLNVTTNVDENHNNITKSATITIIKTTPLMNVTVEPTQNITTKDNPTLTIKLPSDATGEVVIKVNGKKVKDDSANETITINLNNAPGDYVVDVIYSGDKNYESDSKTKEFTISKAETTITANQTTFEEGNASTIEVTIPDINSGIVLVDVEGKKFYGDINNGKAIITLEGLPEGNYTANVKFFGDDIYNEATCTADVKVSEPKIITELKEQLEEAQANATQLKDNLDNVSGQLVDAQANATQLKEDLDELNQTVAGKDAEISNLTDVVAGKDAEISNLTDVVAGKDAEISNLTDVVSGKDAEISNLTDVVSGKDAKIAELNDTVNTKNSTKTIQELKDQVGSLNATVVSQNATIEAQKKQISSLNDTVNTKNSTKTIQELKDQVGSLNATVVSQNATIEAQAKEIDDLKTNVGPLTKKDTKLVVAKTFTRVAVDYKAGERGGMFYAILKDSNGNVLANKTVQIAINGKIYKRTTNNQGRAGIRVNFANANTYSYAISFQGDDTYNAAPMASSKLTVIKKKTAIRASNKVFNAKTKTKKISVILKTVKNKYNKKTYLKSGKKVTLKVNGKTYVAKINKKGVAKFTIKITKEGKYAAKIKFAGDRTYKASSKTIIIRIK